MLKVKNIAWVKFDARVVCRSISTLSWHRKRLELDCWPSNLERERNSVGPLNHKPTASLWAAVLLPPSSKNSAQIPCKGVVFDAHCGYELWGWKKTCWVCIRIKRKSHSVCGNIPEESPKLYFVLVLVWVMNCCTSCICITLTVCEGLFDVNLWPHRLHVPTS